MHMYHSSSYYSILGVVPTATAKEIRTKYMQLARALHPDKNSSQEAQTKLQAINEAWASVTIPQQPAAKVVQAEVPTADL